MAFCKVSFTNELDSFIILYSLTKKGFSLAFFYLQKLVFRHFFYIFAGGK